MRIGIVAAVLCIEASRAQLVVRTANGGEAAASVRTRTAAALAGFFSARKITRCKCVKNYLHV